MLTTRIPQKDGTTNVHTFHLPKTKEIALSEIELWEQFIHSVAGYQVDPKAPQGCSIISLPPDEWKGLMIERHQDDCVNAARQLAVRCGITLKPPAAPGIDPKETKNPKPKLVPKPDEKDDGPAASKRTRLP